MTCADHVALDGVHETMLDPGKSDYPLAAIGVVAQTSCDVAANLNLHTGLVKVDVAVAAQFKAHRVLHDPAPLPVPRRKVSPSGAIREVPEDRRWWANHLADHRKPRFRTIQI